MHSLIEKESLLLLQTYKRIPIIVDYAKGTRIYDIEGNSYLDFLGGIAVNLLGHSHPKIIEAIKEQCERYMHLSNYFYQDAQIKLAEKLLQLTGYNRVFFANSGTEANEGALKICRRWGNQRNKKIVIAFTNGFHGRTYGSLSLMDKPKYKELMEPFLDNIKILPYNNIKALEKEINTTTAAVFLEFIQGEGGLEEASEEFINMLWHLKNKFNFLIVADEIQSGIYRTGNFFAFNKFNVQPDIVTLAKGLGGGLPLGGILLKESLANIFEKGMHGTTFGGNAVACASGLAVLDEISQNLISHINLISKYLWKQLNNLADKFPNKIVEVRGRGLMCGLLLNFDATRLVEALLEEKIIANATSKNVLRLVPPLIISESDVDELINGLNNVLGKI
jgi:predicted acetylornithine/succinylornithine family transaminase